MAGGVFAHWPNRITALRFVGALAVFLVLALHGDVPADGIEPVRGELQLAFWLFLAVALSDVLDGWLARRGNVITAFGRIADPFVDKVLVLGTMVFLAVLPWSRHFFPAWVVVVILAREFLVTGIRGYVESLGLEFAADWFGKVKMFVQCWAVGIAIGLAAFELSEAAERRWTVAGWCCVVATVVTSLGSGLSYVFKARRVLAGSAR
jgi:CDP-diacylglycerol--glycerol-3-phosphate 3-phosphatidyltransferase